MVSGKVLRFFLFKRSSPHSAREDDVLLLNSNNLGPGAEMSPGHEELRITRLGTETKGISPTTIKPVFSQHLVDPLKTRFQRF